MISENQEITIPYILSNAAQNAYEKIKALILKIFSILKKQKEEKNLKKEFYDSYIDFARKLNSEGYSNECYSYMTICEMYSDLIDRPDVLISHESFFMDLFNAFDEILSIRIEKPEIYNLKYGEFLTYITEMQQYYYTKVAIPSPNYNEKTCRKIISQLSEDLL